MNSDVIRQRLIGSVLSLAICAAGLGFLVGGCKSQPNNGLLWEQHNKLVDRVAQLEQTVSFMGRKVESLEYQVRDCLKLAGESTHSDCDCGCPVPCDCNGKDKACVSNKPCKQLPCPAPQEPRAFKVEPRAALPGKIKATLVGEPHDGDTATVQVHVRLAEIDAPELKQPWGPEARGVLIAELKRAKTLLLRVEAVDRYGRVVGTLLNDKKSINQAMIEKGAAWHYKAYSTDASLDVLEESARKQNLGLWGNTNPQAPWDFRHAKGLAD